MRSSDRDDRNGTTCGWPLRLAAVVFAAMVATVPAHAEDLRRHRPGLPDRRAEPAGGDPRETSRGRRGRHARPSAARVAGKGQARRRDPAPVAGSRAPVNRGASTTTRASSCRRPSATPTAGSSCRPARWINPLDTVTLEPGAALHRRARSRAGRACTQAHRRAPGQGEGDPHRRSYLDLMRRWQRPVFYDQQGNLTTKLGIRQVPALVTQDGRRLRIDELL